MLYEKRECHVENWHLGDLKGETVLACGGDLEIPKMLPLKKAQGEKPDNPGVILLIIHIEIWV